MPRPLPLVLLLACASAPVAPPQTSAQSPAAAAVEGEELLATGGELSVPQPRDVTSGLDGARLFAWAQSEVPGDSRLQAALALVDALARAELLKIARVELTATAEVRATADKGVESQSASFAVIERAQGLVQQAAPPKHAWIKVRRGGEVWLRVYARAETAMPDSR